MVAADKIAVLDFGGQYTQLIARRVREMSVFSEVVSRTQPIEPIRTGRDKGVILPGGPASGYAGGAPLPPEARLHRGVPLLGRCCGLPADGDRLRRPRR